ncbi:MAG: nucleotidyl transferase AbiEii/AbiGii toxin family protein [Candidatus Omnitrophica bacterium]|nr:nucleotidyl transferase AbiEii/AbiGii toxin family protein [Candidatus Omnitrophota bacterium]
MQDLIKQEQFEIEVLQYLNSKRLLGNLVFGGGTMLRLCWGLNRFSVDLDFWLIKKADPKGLFKGLKEHLQRSYAIRDAAMKFHTLLFEIKSPRYPRALKIEIRKELKNVETEGAIAYSPHTSIQVILKTITLEEMMKAKIEALVERKEIRDAFDIEFLFKKSIAIKASPRVLKNALTIIQGFTAKDYTVKLGSLLEASQRKYYASSHFKILQSAINEQLADKA